MVHDVSGTLGAPRIFKTPGGGVVIEKIAIVFSENSKRDIVTKTARNPPRSALGELVVLWRPRVWGLILFVCGFRCVLGHVGFAGYLLCVSVCRFTNRIFSDFLGFLVWSRRFGYRWGWSRRFWSINLYNNSTNQFFFSIDLREYGFQIVILLFHLPNANARPPQTESDTKRHL